MSAVSSTDDDVCCKPDFDLGRIAYEARFPADHRRKGYAREWVMLPDNAKMIWIDVAEAVRRAVEEKSDAA